MDAWSQTSSSAVVHGMHPLRGNPVTARITPLRGGGRPEFLVESADGDIDDDDAWRWAAKESVVLSAAQAADLVTQMERRA